MDKIPLILKPIWMRQPDESEEQWRLLIEWASLDRFESAVTFAVRHGMKSTDATLYRWQERAEAYWDDVASQMHAGMKSMWERLNIRAATAAWELLDTDRSEDTTTETRYGVDGEGNKTVRHSTRRRIGPSERVVTLMLTKMHEAMNEQAGIDLTEVLRAMVQDTESGGEPPTDQGMDGEHSPA